MTLINDLVLAGHVVDEVILAELGITLQVSQQQGAIDGADMIVAIFLIEEDLFILESAISLLQSGLTGDQDIDTDLGLLHDAQVIDINGILSHIAGAILDVNDGHFVHAVFQGYPGVAGFPAGLIIIAGHLVNIVAIDDNNSSIHALFGGDDVVKCQSLTGLQLYIDVQHSNGIVLLAIGSLDAGFAVYGSLDEGPDSGAVLGTEGNVEVAGVDGIVDNIVAGEHFSNFLLGNDVFEIVNDLLHIVISGEVLEDLLPDVLAHQSAGVDHGDHAVAVNDDGQRSAVDAKVANAQVGGRDTHRHLQLLAHIPVPNVGNIIAAVVVQQQDLDIIGKATVDIVDSGQLIEAIAAGAAPEVQHYHFLLFQQFGQSDGAVGRASQRSLALGAGLCGGRRIHGIQFAAAGANISGLIHVGEIIHNVTGLETLAAHAFALHDFRTQGDQAGVAVEAVGILLDKASGNLVQLNGVFLAGSQADGAGAVCSGGADIDQLAFAVELHFQLLHGHTASSLDLNRISDLIVRAGRGGLIARRCAAGGGILLRLTSSHRQNHCHSQKQRHYFCHSLHSLSPIHFVI